MIIACSLIFPPRLDHDELNLERHYYKIRTSFLISCLVLGVLVFADGVVIGTEPVWHELRYLQIFFLAILIWGLADRRRLAQYVAALGSLIAAFILLYMGFWLPAGPTLS